MVKVAQALARGLRSEATTRELCADACRAWTPHPVPRSKAAEISLRIVAPTSDIVDALIPRTWSAGNDAPDGWAKSWATSQLAGPPSGRSATRLDTSRSSTARMPPATNCSTSSGASAASASARDTCDPTTNSRSTVSSRSPERDARSSGATSPWATCANACTPSRSVSASRSNPHWSRQSRSRRTVSGLSR